MKFGTKGTSKRDISLKRNSTFKFLVAWDSSACDGLLMQVLVPCVQANSLDPLRCLIQENPHRSCSCKTGTTCDPNTDLMSYVLKQDICFSCLLFLIYFYFRGGSELTFFFTLFIMPYRLVRHGCFSVFPCIFICQQIKTKCSAVFRKKYQCTASCILYTKYCILHPLKA